MLFSQCTDELISDHVQHAEISNIYVKRKNKQNTDRFKTNKDLWDFSVSNIKTVFHIIWIVIALARGQKKGKKEKLNVP